MLRMGRRESLEIGDVELFMKKIESCISFCLIQLKRRRIGEQFSWDYDVF